MKSLLKLLKRADELGDEFDRVEDQIVSELHAADEAPNKAMRDRHEQMVEDLRFRRAQINLELETLKPQVKRHILKLFE